MQTVTDFRVYQSAAKYADRIGMARREAVHEVASAIRDGMTGQHVAGQLQHRAIRSERPTPPEAA